MIFGVNWKHWVGMGRCIPTLLNQKIRKEVQINFMVLEVLYQSQILELSLIYWTNSKMLLKKSVSGDNFGCDYFQVTEKNGLRCSTAVGYLNPVKKRKNLKIVVKAHVKQINFDGKKAVGISYWHDNELISVKANKEVILSAGAIGSPHVLQASGIGNEKKLQELDINMVHHNPNVGQNLQDHLMLRPVYI